jgi:KamA family protein
MTKSLCDILTGHRLATVVVVHANHPRELGAEAREALGGLYAAGVTLLNQSVLLRGVNDSVEVLEALSESLFESRVLPYYLHQLDRVRGSAHFAVPDTEARRLIAALRSRLSGFLVPRLVRDEKDQPFKLPLC